MTLMGQADGIGLSRLSEYGLVGVMLALALYALIAVWKQNTSNLVDWRVEARTDLQEERKSRQAHEMQVTKLLGELIVQATEQREAMAEIKEAMARNVEAMNRIIDQMSRIAGAK